MSWAKVFKINSNMKIPLNKLLSNSFYDLAVIINKGYGDIESDVLIIPYGTQRTKSKEYEMGVMKIVVCPETLKGIEGYPFYQCGALETIFIQEGLETIGPQSFSYCYKLKSIRLPSSITQISPKAFLETGITDIYVPWAEGQIADAPWGADNATVHYNC